MASITKRNNTYKITVSCGYDMNGKQLRKSLTWKPDPNMTPKQIEKELERQKVLFEEKVNQGTYLDDNIKFADFVQIWLTDYAEKQLAPKTIQRYKDFLKRILPAIGHVKIGKLQPRHLLQFYNTLSETESAARTKFKPQKDVIDYVSLNKVSSISKQTGIAESTIRDIKKGNSVTGKTAKKLCAAIPKCSMSWFDKQIGAHLSGNTILHHHRLISCIMTTAVQWQVISSNPCARVKPPKAERKEAVYLDNKQAMHLVELLEAAPHMYRTMVITLLYTGMRLGELCGLEWKDVDFDNHIIYIRRSSQYLPGKGIFTKEPKNKTSIRANRYAAELFLLLRQHEQYQITERLKLGDKWQDTDRLFTQWNGSYFLPGTLSNWFTDFIKTTDLPKVTIHSLRHTNATLLIAGGVDIRTVSKRLGHSQASTTMNIYAHALQSADDAAAEIIDLKVMKNAQ